MNKISQLFVILALASLGMPEQASAQATADSTTWEGLYEADTLPNAAAGWANSGAGNFTSLGTGPDAGTVNLNNLTQNTGFSFGLWEIDPSFNFTTGSSFEIRAKVNTPTSTPDAMTINLHDGTDDLVRLRLFGSQQAQVAYGTSYGYQTFGVDTSQYNTYRITMLDGTDNVRVYLNDNPFPVGTGTLEQAGIAPQRGLFFGDVTTSSGQQSDWSIDYIRWTNQGAFGVTGPTPLPPVTGPGSRVGMVTSFVDTDQFTQLTRDAGAGNVRLNFSWANFEPANKGEYNWTFLDSMVLDATAQGLEVYASLIHTPAWARGGTGDEFSPPTNSQDWYDAVNAVVSRYKDYGNITWGIWNEPNLPGFWAGSRQDFIDNVLKVAIDAIQAADPSAQIAAPEIATGPTNGNWYDWQGWVTDVFDQAGADIDIFAAHLYRASTGETDADFTAALDAIKPIVDQVGKPFWLTETGWEASEAGSEQAVADNYAGLLETWLRGDPNRDWVEKFFFFALAPGIPSEFNLLDDNDNPRPAYLAIQDFLTSGIGDFDNDGDVDGADFLFWQRNMSVGNLADWETNFGTTGNSAVSGAADAVPEPTTGLLAAWGLFCLMKMRIREKKQCCDNSWQLARRL